MNTPVKLLLAGVVALGLGACEKKSEPAGSATGQPSANQGNSQPVTPAQPVQPAKTAWTQATSEGALRLFLTAMAEGRFADATALVDQGSESYEDFEELNKTFDPATANPKIDQTQLEMIKGLFTKPWEGATVALVSEAPPRAEYTVTLANGREKKVELNQFEGNWYILATKSLLSPGTPSQPPAGSAEGPSGN